MRTRILFGFIFLFSLGCKSKANSSETPQKIRVAAEMMEEYLPMLAGKNVGLVVNHTSMVNQTHLLDTLLSRGVAVKKIFAPEHGFRGEADAGAHIANGKDPKTGLPIISIYGKNKKPSSDQLKGLDIIIFDIQDIGVRFYTYSSTLHYVIQAAAEENLPLLVFDRPNPNGHYVAGPVLEKEQASFVGLNPLPVVYGLTSGELSNMINGEHWASELNCDLTVIKTVNYTHSTPYTIPVKTSPNMPNNQAVYLYPSICFFEPTKISVGRGTDKQFQIIGGTQKEYGDYKFTPIDKPGAHNPKNKGKSCYGIDLSTKDAYHLGFDLSYLVEFYAKTKNKKEFFTSESFFNKLMGNSWVLADLKSGKSQKEIKAKWQPALEDYKKLRKNYLLYPDFE